MYDVRCVCSPVKGKWREKTFDCVVKTAVFPHAVAIAESYIPGNWIPDRIECEWIPNDAELIDGVRIYSEGKPGVGLRLV